MASVTRVKSISGTVKGMPYIQRHATKSYGQWTPFEGASRDGKKLHCFTIQTRLVTTAGGQIEQHFECAWLDTDNVGLRPDDVVDVSFIEDEGGARRLVKLRNCTIGCEYLGYSQKEEAYGCLQSRYIYLPLSLFIIALLASLNRRQ